MAAEAFSAMKAQVRASWADMPRNVAWRPTDANHKWETGVGIPDVENLAALARLFDVSLDSLVDGVPTPPVDTDTVARSQTQVDITREIDLDINAGCAHAVSLTGSSAEKVQVTLSSAVIEDINQAFKVQLDTNGPHFDINVVNTGIVSDAAAREGLAIDIALPVRFAHAVEISVNADRCALRDLSGELELSGLIRQLDVLRCDAHIELDISGDTDITARQVTGRIDVNQMNATSTLHLEDAPAFSAATKGRLGRRTLRFTRDGEPCEAPELPIEAPLAIELAGMGVELTIDMTSDSAR